MRDVMRRERALGVRSQMFWTLVEPPSQLTLPELCEPLSIIFDQV